MYHYKSAFPVAIRYNTCAPNPHKAQPSAQEVINKCVDHLEPDGIIEEGASLWSILITVVTRQDGTPRVCVDSRQTFSPFLVRESRSLPVNKTRTNSAGGAHFLPALEFHSAYTQSPIEEAYIQKASSSTTEGKDVSQTPTVWNKVHHKVVRTPHGQQLRSFRSAEWFIDIHE